MKYKLHTLHLKSASKLSGTDNDYFITTQGIGEGGTIRKGYVRVDYLHCTATHSNHYRPQDPSFNIKVKCPSIPFVDIALTSLDTNKTTNKIDMSIQIVNNNKGDGNHFGFYNENTARDSNTGRYFENFNTAQPINIIYSDINDDALGNALTPHYLGLTFIEILEE